MMYATIVNGQIARIDSFNAEMPAHKLAGRTDLLPIEEAPPTYDGATEQLGGETLTIEAGRVVKTWAVVVKPEPPRDIQVELEAKVAALESLFVGNADPTAPDARTDIKAIIAALTAKEIITTAEIDAQRRSSYRDNGDGTISLLDKFGSPSVTFTPGDDVPEASVYATWLAMGGKPMPPAAALEANNAP